MADRKPWSTKRRMKERSARLVAAKRARASEETSAAAVTPSSPEVDTSTIASTSSSLQRERERPQQLSEEDQGASVV